MDAILANVFLAVQDRLAAGNLLRFIDQDMGQLDFYNDDDQRIPVAFPAGLLDIVDIGYSDNTQKLQQGEAVLELRLALTSFVAGTHYYSQAHKEKAIEYFNLEHEVVRLLHGWSDDQYFNPLTRIGAQTEKRQDNIRVRVLRFKFGFRDNTAVKLKHPVARPDMEIIPQ